MATAGSQAQTRPIAIAPAPISDGSHENEDAQHTMSYACQTCTRRKVKCDKLTPTCSTCRKGGLGCVYQAPIPRKRKRRPSGDVNERLERYERLLQEHGIVDASPTSQDSSTVQPAPKDNSTRIPNEPSNERVGKLLSGQGKTRYIDSNLWYNLGEAEMQNISEDEGDETPMGNLLATPLDPVTGTLLGISQNLLTVHPRYEDAMRLWDIFVYNVEPICKLVHVPSTLPLVKEAAQNPAGISKSMEALIFAIYHFAIVSLTDEDCVLQFGQLRSSLLPRYQSATKIALVNASLLKTTELPVLQAYVLFLLSTRTQIDPNTFWILTGVAFRIAQRMGLHKDGETLGLPPFDVEMRRRIFYQLLPLDGMAAAVSGVGVTVGLHMWDTKQPSNYNDDQIWPGMQQKPEVQPGASDMIFCLARSEFNKFHVRTKGLYSFGRPGKWTLEDQEEMEKAIDGLQELMESKYIRYCDLVEPLHFLTLCMARGAAAGSRLRVRLARSRDLGSEKITDQERIELFNLALKISDYDIAVHTQPGLNRYSWHTRAIFQWDVQICIFTLLRRPGLLSKFQIDSAWTKMEQVFKLHPELLTARRAIYVALCRITLRAWEDTHPPENGQMGTEPEFVHTLRALRASHLAKNTANDDTATTNATHSGVQAASQAMPQAYDNQNSGVQDPNNLGFDMNFDLDSPDWDNWDQLIKDFMARPEQLP